MNREYMAPFMESIVDFFSSMLSSKAEQVRICLDWTGFEADTVCAIIGISGPVRGSVLLCMSTETAKSIVCGMLNSDECSDELLVDGVAEAVNIIAGGAKTRLAQNFTKPIGLGLPNVIRGADFCVDSFSHSVWTEAAFESDLGPFRLQVTLEQVDKKIGSHDESAYC